MDIYPSQLAEDRVLLNDTKSIVSAKLQRQAPKHVFESPKRSEKNSLKCPSFDRVTIWKSSHHKVHHNLHSPAYLTGDQTTKIYVHKKGAEKYGTRGSDALHAPGCGAKRLPDLPGQREEARFFVLSLSCRWRSCVRARQVHGCAGANAERRARLVKNLRRQQSKALGGISLSVRVRPPVDRQILELE
jgi:hypothetical protein